MKLKKITSTINNYFNAEEIEEFDKKNNDFQVDIIINSKTKYQKHYGFGGAFTDSSGLVYSLMSNKNKKEFLKAYFSKDGLNYNLGRISIGSCDFSDRIYDYCSNSSMSDFSLEEAKKYVIPLIRDALKINKDLHFMASSWSPPAFYKTNNAKIKGGKLKEDCYVKYAEYIVKFVDLIKKENIYLKYLTIQNEPLAKQTWESCIFTSLEEAKLGILIKNKLEDKKINDVQLFVWDHNKDVIVERIKETLNYQNLYDLASGIAYHWYDGTDYSNVEAIHNLYKNKLIFLTEGCVELLNFKSIDYKENIGNFQNGIRYIENYILGANSFTNAFIDWNLLLFSDGGVNHVGNFCEAPIMYNQLNKKLIFNPSYYCIKHFAHFVHVNSFRIDVANNSKLLVTSYLNTDGKKVVIILNKGKETAVIIQIDNILYKCYIKNESINTLIV